MRWYGVYVAKEEDKRRTLVANEPSGYVKCWNIFLRGWATGDYSET
jgi:hypothetical protein